MKKRLGMKIGAVFLATCVMLSGVPTTALASAQSQQTTVVDGDTTQTNQTTDSTTDNTTNTDATKPEDDNHTTDSTTTQTDGSEKIDSGEATTDQTKQETENEATNPQETTNTTESNETTNPQDTTNTPETNDTTQTQTNETENTNENKENEETNPTDLKDPNAVASKEEDKELEDSVPRHSGYNSVDNLRIPTLYDGSYYPNQMGALPSSYDPRAYGYLTPVRDQGIWGSCWAFSAIAMAEANLVKKNLANNTLDLSELQLAYFFYHTVADPLGNTAGDSNYALTDYYLDLGGNSAFTTFALASWTGVASEAKAPYAWADNGIDYLDPSLAFDDDYHMQNAYWINMLDISDVKNMIMQYGGVSTSYYAWQNGNMTTTYYNGATKAFYYDGSYITDHAILIVGWDDSFDRMNFNEAHRPTSNGAWLVKNSWGTEFGDAGYFWISYEDATLTNEDYSQAYVFDFESGDNYDHNYQYDGSGSAGYAGSVLNGGSIANVFTAKANAAGGAENINAVSFALYDVNVDYSIQIYTNLSNANDPTSGRAMLSTPKTGRTSYVGYYTVPLDNSIEVAEGSNFSVVITLARSASNVAYYFCDYSYTNGDWIQFVNETQTGQSFMKYSSRYGWYDLENEGMTARIKAFTTDTTLSQPTSVTLNSNALTLKAGETKTLIATTSPIAQNSASMAWSSSNNAVATVDGNGTVTATGVGKATITVTTQNGLTATCAVTGNIGKVANLKASQTTNRIKLSWDKQSGVTGYEIYRYNAETRKYEKIATNKKATQTSFNDKSKEAGTNYQYKVRAYITKKKKNTYGSYSSILKTGTKTVSPSLSGTPQSKKAKLNWEKVDGASGYEIYMSTKKKSGFSLIKTIKKGKTVSFTKKGLIKNKKYYFKVRTYKNVSGTKIYSGYSKVITIKVK